MPDWRPTCLIGDPLVTDMPHRIPTCFIGDQPWARYVFLMGLWRGMLDSDGSLMRHVGLRWVSAETWRSPIRQACLRSGMSVSEGSRFRHVGLQWVSDMSLIGL